jgi:hypothetical protein
MSSSSIETTTTTARQISVAFQQSGGHFDPLPSALLTKLSHLSESLHLSPKELVDAWEAHSLTKNVDSLNEASYGGFRLALSKLAGGGGGGSSGGKKKKSSNTNVIATTGLGKRTPGVTPSPMAKRATSTTPPAVASSSSSTNSGGVGRDGLSAIDNLTTPSGKKGAHTASVITPIPHNTTTTTANNNNNNTTSIKYTERTNAGEIVSSYNPHNLSTFSEVLHSSMKSEEERKELMSRRVCSITVLPTTTATAASSKNSNHHQYRHMFTPLEKRSAALEHRLLDMNTAICDMYKYKSEEDEMMELTMDDGNGGNTTNEEDGNSGGRNDNSTAVMWTPVGLPKQNKVVCIGRICNEVRVCISFYIIFTS